MIRLVFTLFVALVLSQVVVSQSDNDTINIPVFRQEIKSEQFNQGAISDPFQLIQGRVPGVNISKRGSDPAIFNKVLIRGVSSFYKNDPLFIIDGIWDADPTMINSMDIESFEILKDVAETSLYGSRGASGVIIIKTKPYEGDKPLLVDFNSWLSLNTPAKKMKLLSSDRYREYLHLIGEQNNVVDGGCDIDWQKELIQNSISHNTELVAQGRLNSTMYSFGITQSNNNGMLPESDRGQVGMKLNLKQTLFSERMKISFGTMYNQTKENRTQLTPSGFNTVLFDVYTRNPTSSSSGNVYPIWGEKSKKNNLYMLGSLNYKLSKGLEFQINGDVRLQEQSLSSPQYWYEVNQSLTNKVKLPLEKSYNLGSSFHYFTSVFSKDIFKAFIGLKHHRSKTVLNLGNYPSIFYEPQYHFDRDFLSKEHLSFEIFGSLTYGLRNKYFITFNGSGEYVEYAFNYLYPWSIEFMSVVFNYDHVASFKNKEFYPSFIGAWRVSNENFLKEISKIDVIDVMIGYGFAGNDLYENQRPMFLVKSNDKTEELSLGLDFSIFGNKIYGNIRRYSRVRGGVPYIPESAFDGYVSKCLIRNKGFESIINITLIQSDRLKWISGFSFSYNLSKIRVPYPQFMVDRYSGGMLYYWQNQILRDNSPVWVFTIPNPDAEVLKGSVIPTQEIGWNNSIAFFKNIETSFSLRYVSGHSIYNKTRIYLLDPNYYMFNRSEEVFAFEENGQFAGTSPVDFLEKANFLRLDYITMGYNLKPRFMGIEGNIKLYAGANNLFTLTKYKGLDPAFDFNAGGNDNFNVYPLARSFVVGVKAVF